MFADTPIAACRFHSNTRSIIVVPRTLNRVGPTRVGSNANPMSEAGHSVTVGKEKDATVSARAVPGHERKGHRHGTTHRPQQGSRGGARAN